MATNIHCTSTLNPGRVPREFGPHRWFPALKRIYARARDGEGVASTATAPILDKYVPMQVHSAMPKAP
jgi:hypothetical protein